MADPVGPQGTGQQFQNAVAKFQAKGKTSLQARRIVASAGIGTPKKKKRRLVKKKK